MGRSDLVRRAMSKKKHKVMEEERKNFIYGIVDKDGNVEVPGCVRNGISEDAANKIYDMMMDFASYAFNKSHAAAYGVVGYQTAYLMRYYPVEMIAAMLNSVIGTSEKVAHYIKFAESQGIQVVPPNVNKSYARFTVEGDKIIFGLAAIRNVGANAVLGITNARDKKGEFTSIMDFINKIDLSAINKRAVESLIKAGALDCFKVYRSKLLAVFEKLMDGVANEKKRNIDGQISLFALEEDKTDLPEVDYPNIKEFNKRNLLAMEKEMTGMYLSGHPLDDYVKSLKMQTTTEINSILEAHKILEETSENGLEDEVLDDIEIHDNQTVILGGILTEVNQKVTRNNTIMAFAKLEDLSGEIEVVIFPKTLDRVRDSVVQDALVTIKGRISLKEDEEPKLLCEKVEGLEKVNSEKVYIRVKDTVEMSIANKDLKYNYGEYKGDTAIYLFNEKDRKSYRLSRDTWINTESNIISALKEKYGEKNVKIVEK